MVIDTKGRRRLAKAAAASIHGSEYVIDGGTRAGDLRIS